MPRPSLFPLLVAVVLTACETRPAEKPSPDPRWQGAWERSARNEGATLTITQVTADSVHFSITAMYGANIGELEGVALLRDSVTAFFEQAMETDTCRLTFVRTGDSVIQVKEQQGTCFAGMGVGYEGNYYHPGDLRRPPAQAAETAKKEESLVELGLLDNATVDAEFRALVKNDYALFTATTQSVSDEDDLDSLHAVVRTAGIPGLYTQMENIVMVDTAQHIWAAVLNDQKVLYYSNHSEYLDKIPATIGHWLERFKDYPVILKNKP